MLNTILYTSPHSSLEVKTTLFVDYNSSASYKNNPRIFTFYNCVVGVAGAFFPSKEKTGVQIPYRALAV